MINKLKLSASAVALALVLAGGASSAQAADVIAEPGCSLNGSVMAGYMYNWQDVSTDLSITETDPPEIESKDFDFDGDPEWQTPFGEGAALFTCGGLNIQGDFAWYGHTTEVEIDGKDDFDVDQDNKHAGGALFYRDPSWAGGISASLISRDIEGKDADVARVGLFGEFYFDDAFTFGASAHYYNTDWPSDGVEDKDEDGFELAAWGRFYPTPNFSLMLRGDLLLPNSKLNFDIPGGEDIDVDADWDVDDGFAITGEAEYLVWDQGLSIFGGVRYAERSMKFDFLVEEDDGESIEFNTDTDVEDFQVYAGVKFYFDFGRERTLVDNHRLGAVDNTSVFHEKLPELITSAEVGFADAIDEDDFVTVQ
jgi:hypothetical protein